MKQLSARATALMLLLSTFVANAADSPYRDGVVNQLPSKTDPRIVISDQIYDVAKNVVVRRSATATVPIQLVRTGQKIRFLVSGEGPGVRGTVTEIVLP